MISYKKKLTEVKKCLEKILEEDFKAEIDELAIADELEEIWDSLDEVEDMYESNSLNDFDGNLYKKILHLKRKIIDTFDIFDDDIELELIDQDYAGYFDDEEED